jgi:hypothetical protein
MTQLPQFGQVAVRMGFVSQSQVKAALEIQESMEKAGRERRLIGMIMLETGMISSHQLIDILKYYESLEEAEREQREAERLLGGDPSATSFCN